MVDGLDCADAIGSCERGDICGVGLGSGSSPSFCGCGADMSKWSLDLVNYFLSRAAISSSVDYRLSRVFTSHRTSSSKSFSSSRNR